MTEKDLKKLFESKLDQSNFEFDESNWEAFEQMADSSEPLSEQEFSKLFRDKLGQASFPFSQTNWEAFEQMNNPAEPLSEQEYKKLFRDKLKRATFPFNPANWEAMEEELGPENGMSGSELQELFQKKAAESQFAFNPDNWARMEAILDQREARPLTFYWRSAAAILLLAALSMLVQWQASPVLNDPNSVPVESISNTSFPENQDPLIPASTPKTSGSKSSSGLDGGKNESIPPVNASNTINSPVAAALPVALPSPITENESYQSILLASRDLVPQFVQYPSLAMSYVEAPVTVLPPRSEPYVPTAYSRVYLVGGPALSAPMNGKMGSPGWQAGLEYEYGFNDHYSISTGVIYNRSGDIGLETLHDSTFFGLGRTDVETHRHYKNLNSLRIPINFRYAVNSRHSFGLGLNTDVLLDVSMDETRTTTVFKQDPKVERHSYHQPMNSFEPVNFSASISYQYQYSPRLSIALSYAMALNDITRDNAQNFEAEHRPGQANLQLRYRLFEE